MSQYYMLFKKLSLFTSCLLFSCFCSTAQPTVSYGSAVVSGLNNPVDVVNAGDSRLFIGQQDGMIKSWNGTTLSTFMDLSTQAGLFPSPLGSEQGLLSIAFHPSFSTNRYFFIWYTGSTGAVTLARYRANAGNLTGDPASGVILLSIEKPNQPNYFKNHNGGKLNFGTDGMLYIGTGDGGDGGDPFNNSQNTASLLGKMLRLDVDDFATAAPFYAIPPDNPFAGNDGIADEIFALGLRNPWRWSFDRANGNMWIADVGQEQWEEVNYNTPALTAAGINYGWRCREGKHNYNTAGCTGNYSVPIFEYPHNNATGGFSITGGYVYHGPDAQNAALTGTYIAADYVSGNLWFIQPDGSSVIQTGLATSIAGFGEAIDGTLYAVRRAAAPNGGLYKIMLTGVLPVTLKSFTGTPNPQYNQLQWITATEQNTRKFLVQYSATNGNFETVGEVAATGNATGSNYSYRHNISGSAASYYRLATIDADGTTSYSAVISLPATGDNDLIKIYPTTITNSMITIATKIPATRMQVIGMDGRIIFEKSLANIIGINSVVLPNLSKGMYIIQVMSKDNTTKTRIVVP